MKKISLRPSTWPAVWTSLSSAESEPEVTASICFVMLAARVLTIS